MNFVAALLLTYLPEPEAFGALVVLMQDRGLRRYYSTDMALLQVGVWGRGPQAAAGLQGGGMHKCGPGRREFAGLQRRNRAFGAPAALVCTRGLCPQTRI